MADYPVTPLTPPLTEQEIIRRLEAGEASLDIYGWNRG